MRHVVLALALALPGFAQKPDFSGTWTLNIAKSTFGSQAEEQVPQASTLTIASTDGEIKIKTISQVNGQEVTSEDTFQLDGSPILIADLKTTAKWDGESIVINGIGRFKGKTLKMDQRYHLSADKKVLTQEVKVTAPPVADVSMKLMYERAPEVTDFSGTWELNPAKSNFGSVPEEFRPTAITRVMTQTADGLTLDTDQTTAQGSTKTSFKLKLDGSETVNNVDGVGLKSIGKLNGPNLEMIYRRPLNDQLLEILEKDFLAEGGRVLIVETQINGTPMGVITTRYVFDKQ